MPYTTPRIAVEWLITVALLAGAATTHAQSPSGPFSPELLARIQGPPPPDLPALAARDAKGRLTIRAVKLTAPLTIDGELDEDLYRSYNPVSDFIQAEPNADTPATEK